MLRLAPACEAQQGCVPWQCEQLCQQDSLRYHYSAQVILSPVTCGLLCAGPASLDVFGIFDGHGGKQAAAFASKHLVPVLLGELRQGSKPSRSPGSHPCAAAAGGSSGCGGAGGRVAGSDGGPPEELDEAAELMACEEVRAWGRHYGCDVRTCYRLMQCLLRVR